MGQQHGGRLEAAMDQAVLAARIAAGPQPVPVGRVDQLAVGRVVGVAEQIAGAAPAADVVGRDWPRRRRAARAGRGGTPGRSARPSAGTAASSCSGGAELLVDFVAGHEDPLGRPADRTAHTAS